MKIPKQTGKLIFPQLGAGSACGLGLGETEMPGQEGSYHNSPCRRRGCVRRRAAECLRQNHSWATLQFRDYCCVRLHHLSLLDGSCSQSQHTISTNFIFSNIVGCWQAGRLAGGGLQCRHCTTVIIGDKCLHHFCSPRDSKRPPEFQNFWWGQAYVVGIICPSDCYRVN